MVVFFGYTQCPDVCPTTMAEVAEVKRSLGADGDRVQGVFVTVDPERDTASLLKAYVGSFDPSFVGLRAASEVNASRHKEFKVFYAKVPGKHRAPTPWTTRPRASSSTPKGARARVRPLWRWCGPDRRHQIAAGEK